jgi:hypothetical protein
MEKINHIPGITDNEINSLNQQGINTVADLWQQVGRDFNNGIDASAEQAGIEKDRLTVLLKAQALKESDTQGSWLSCNWMELSLLVGLLIIMGLYFRARASGVLAWIVWPIGWQP